MGVHFRWEKNIETSLVNPRANIQTSLFDFSFIPVIKFVVLFIRDFILKSLNEKFQLLWIYNWNAKQRENRVFEHSIRVSLDPVKDRFVPTFRANFRRRVEDIFQSFSWKCFNLSLHKVKKFLTFPKLFEHELSRDDDVSINFSLDKGGKEQLIPFYQIIIYISSISWTIILLTIDAKSITIELFEYCFS